MILKRQRSEEEKLRRHLHGDKGAKFSGGKIPCVDGGGIIGAITTMVTKDILLLEMRGRIILLDDYNANLHGDGTIGTVTPQFGNSAPRNGWKIIEEYEQ